MPERFLLQILRSLVTGGVLRSTRGVEGGYYLARPPEKISLLDIYISLDDPLTLTTRPIEALPTEIRESFGAVLDRAAEAARRELAEVSLTDLLNSKTLKSEIA
jgi:Rrf2 family protein